MLGIDLRGKRAFVAGVADDGGFGFAIAKALAEAGARVSVGTWPPAMGIFEKLLKLGKMDASLTLSDGTKLELEAIVPLDADFDTLDDAPEDVRSSKRYAERGDFSIQGAADLLRERFGEQSFDVVVHSLANGPEVKNPLLETSRKGYLAAVGASAYSFTALVQRFGTDRDHGPPVVTVQVAALASIVEQPMTVTEVDLARDVIHPRLLAHRTWLLQVPAPRGCSTWLPYMAALHDGRPAAASRKCPHCTHPATDSQLILPGGASAL